MRDEEELEAEARRSLEETEELREESGLGDDEDEHADRDDEDDAEVADDED